MRGVNKTTLIGYCGKDAEKISFPNGGSITKVSLATTETWKDKKGEDKERTEWHQVVFRGKLADFAQKYLLKGTPVYLEGQLRTRKWTKDGHDNYATEIHAYDVELLGRKQGETTPASPAAEARAEAAGFGGPDDDIPF